MKFIKEGIGKRLTCIENLNVRKIPRSCERKVYKSGPVVC